MSMFEGLYIPPAEKASAVWWLHNGFVLALIFCAAVFI